MTEEVKSMLFSARYSVIEADSIKASIEEVERLMQSIASPNIGRTHDKTNKESYRNESLLDAKATLEQSLSNAFRAATSSIFEAERYIENIPNPKKRAALRYYFISGVKSYEEVAEMCSVDVRTVKRWFS